MRYPAGPIRRWCLGLVAVLTLSVIHGCSPRSADEMVSERERVVGTWEYKTDGIPFLQRGSLHITVEDGKLVGRLQDSWRGSLQARINLQGNRMTVEVDRGRIEGRLDRDHFRGTIRPRQWDLSRSVEGHSQSTGYFLARRVRSTSLLNNRRDLSCPSLLRESSYACPALLP